MKKLVKSVYEAPVVELFDARVEKGFAGSGDDPDNVVDPTLEPEHSEDSMDDSFTGM